VTAATVTALGPTEEQRLLEAARAGDEHAFRRIVEEHRRPLHAHCYRMLGSLQDAEDALQETFLRAWRGLRAFGGRSTVRNWLYRIATNVCLDATSRGPKLMLSAEPYRDELLGVRDAHEAPSARYEQREAVELAFLASLQHLPASQRAVLILRDVFGFSAREVSERLHTSVASVNSALQRARKAVDERLPDQSEQTPLRAVGDERTQALVDALVDAWTRRDVEAVAALLAEEAVFSMPPWAARSSLETSRAA
jgi:RNA polymerase sigma-70 factor (ECF subfamily)